MGTAKDTHTHAHTNTRQLEGILNWRPLVLSLWPEAVLQRIEPAFISDAGFRVVTYFPLLLFWSFHLSQKCILCLQHKDGKLQGDGNKKQSLTPSENSFQLLYMLFRSYSAFDEDHQSVKLWLCPDVLRLCLWVLWVIMQPGGDGSVLQYL